MLIKFKLEIYRYVLKKIENLKIYKNNNYYYTETRYNHDCNFSSVTVPQN